ncbi:MAG: VOC family protein [Acidimicrobiales bacterium]
MDNGKGPQIFEGIHHVAITVADLEEARSFYGGILRLEELDRPDFGVPGVWYSLGSSQQLHIAAFDDHVTPRRSHFALRVSDLDEVADRLQTAGVDIRRSPNIPGAGRQAAFNDPAGNLVELNQPID